MTMLFSHSVSFVFEALTMSEMKLHTFDALSVASKEKVSATKERQSSEVRGGGARGREGEEPWIRWLNDAQEARAGVAAHHGWRARGPVVRPVLLDDLNENNIELAHEEFLRAIRLLVTRASNHQVDDERLNPYALFGGQRLPSKLDCILEDLQRIKLGVR